MPRYPIAMQDDTPILMLRGYSMRGRRIQPESHVAYYRTNGKLRARPLVPTDNPLRVVAKLETSQQWTFSDHPGWNGHARGRVFVMNQVLRLVDTVYRLENDIYGQKISIRHDVDERWKLILDEFSKLDVRWDSENNVYTFRDGSQLPLKPINLYHRKIWPLDLPDRDVRLILERQDRRYLRIELSYVVQSGGDQHPPTSVRVYRVSDRSSPLADLSVPGDPGMGASSATVALAEGEQVEAEMVVSGKVVATSPVYEP